MQIQWPNKKGRVRNGSAFLMHISTRGIIGKPYSGKPNVRFDEVEPQIGRAAATRFSTLLKPAILFSESSFLCLRFINLPLEYKGSS
jgi:hypothetical protein